MAKKLNGKVAIVTGSGQGVGKGIAVGLAREGAKVVTNNRKPGADKMPGDVNLSEADKQKFLALRGDAEGTAAQIIAEGGEAIPFYGDVSDYKTAGELIGTALEAFGRVDIVVNNAAGLGSGMLVSTTEDDWDYQTVPKLKGAFNCMRHAVPHMIEQGFGRVINVASYAWIGLPALSAYSAANAGLVGLTKSTAKELHKVGITVNAICPEAASPGHVLEFSGMKDKLSKAGVQIDEAKLKEIDDAHGPAENLAPFLAYLSIPEAAYINGAVFEVTGGGRISLFSESVMTKTITKTDSPWTLDELIEAAPKQLLDEYTSIVKLDELGTLLDG